MTDIPDETFDQLADDIAAAIETHHPMGIEPSHVRPHVAGLLRNALDTAEDDEKN